MPRIYRKWKDALPDLENALSSRSWGARKSGRGPGRTYRFTEAEKDAWANLFEYKGSDEHVRLRFSIDNLGATLDDAVLVYEDAQDHDAWERFIASLKEKPEKRTQAAFVAIIPQQAPAVMPTVVQENLVKPLRYRNVVLIAALAVIVGIACFILWQAYGPSTPVARWGGWSFLFLINPPSRCYPSPT